MSLMAGARSRSTPAAYLDLDWRDLVTANQIQGRLRALLMDLDDGGYAEITPSESQASKNSLVSTQTTTTNVMDDVPTMVRINKSMRKHIGRNMPYFAKLYLIAEWVRANLGQHGTQGIKRIFYTVYPETMGYDIVKRALFDLAVTLKVHPVNLGIEMDADGALWVHDGIDIKIWVVDNILNAAQAKSEVGEKAMLSGPCCKAETLRGFRKGVPTKVYRMKASGRKGKHPIRGVIVCEHSNLMIDSKWMQDNLPGAIVLLEMAAKGPESESTGLLSCIYKNDYLKYESRGVMESLDLIRKGEGNFGLGTLSKYARQARGKETWVIVDFNTRVGVTTVLVTRTIQQQNHAIQLYQAYRESQGDVSFDRVQGLSSRIQLTIRDLSSTQAKPSTQRSLGSSSNGRLQSSQPGPTASLKQQEVEPMGGRQGSAKRKRHT